jgi:hypothetical protein
MGGGGRSFSLLLDTVIRGGEGRVLGSEREIRRSCSTESVHYTVSTADVNLDWNEI